MFIKDYYKRVMYLLLSEPMKIPAFLRLAGGVKRLNERKLLRGDNMAPPPLSLCIAVTYRCNLRCVQCAQWGDHGWLKTAGEGYFKKEMTTKQLKSFILDVAGFRPFIQFSGGEPLLRDDIAELIRFADSRGLLTSMTTNSVLLEEKAEELVRSGLKYLYASLDGPKEVNDAIRGDGTADKIVKGVKAVLEARKKLKSMFPIVEVRTCLVKENQHWLLDAATFVEREIKPDAYCIMLEFFFFTDAMVEKTSKAYQQAFGITPAHLKMVKNIQAMDTKHIAEQIKKIKNSRWSFRFRLREPLGEEHFPFEDFFNNPEKMLFGLTFCGSLYSFAMVEPDGNMPTCATTPEFIAGNVTREGFMDIWNGEKFRRFRARLRQGLFPICSRCRHIYTFTPYKK